MTELACARALLARGNHREARDLLETLTSHGDPHVADEARELLDDLRPDPVALIVAAITLLLAATILIAVL